jgi:hypothetical protein
MTQDRIAKNLLEGKTCDKCEHYRDDEHSPLSCSLWKLPLPVERTCEKWVINPFGLLGPKILLPLVRRVYPSMIAKELISVQPSFDQKSSIFYLKYKGRFKAWLRRVVFTAIMLFAALLSIHPIAFIKIHTLRLLNGLKETAWLSKTFRKK